MVKYPIEVGLAERKAEIRYYKTIRNAEKFWENLPKNRKISKSYFQNSSLTLNGERYFVVIEYYIE